MDRLIRRLVDDDQNRSQTIPESWLLHLSDDAILALLNALPHDSFKALSFTCKRLHDLSKITAGQRLFIHRWDEARFSPRGDKYDHPLDLLVHLLSQPHLGRLLTNLRFQGGDNRSQNWVPGVPRQETVNRLSGIVPFMARELRNTRALTPEQQTAWVRNAIRIRRGDVSIILILALCSNLRTVFLADMSPEMIQKLDMLLDHRFFSQRPEYETLPGFSGSMFSRLAYLRLNGENCFGGLTSKLLLLPTLGKLDITDIYENTCDVVLGQKADDPIDLTECQIEQVTVWRCRPWPGQLALFIKHLPKLKQLCYNFGDYPIPTDDFDPVLATYLSIVVAGPSQDTTEARRTLADHPTFIQRQFDMACEYMNEFDEILDEALDNPELKCKVELRRPSSDLETRASNIGIKGQFYLLVKTRSSNEQT